MGIEIYTPESKIEYTGNFEDFSRWALSNNWYFLHDNELTGQSWVTPSGRKVMVQEHEGKLYVY